MLIGAVLLVVHVAAAVLFIGPAAVAASLLPAYVPIEDAPSKRRDGQRSRSVALALHRISRVCGVLALIVPIVGLLLGLLWNKFGQAWLLTAMLLTVIAGALYALRIVPAQSAALAAPASRRRVTALSGLAGVFNVLWLAVLVLMVLQPGGPRP